MKKTTYTHVEIAPGDTIEDVVSWGQETLEEAVEWAENELQDIRDGQRILVMEVTVKPVILYKKETKIITKKFK